MSKLACILLSMILSLSLGGSAIAQQLPTKNTTSDSTSKSQSPPTLDDKLINMFEYHLLTISLILGVGGFIAVALQLILQWHQAHSQKREKDEEKRREEASQKRVEKMERAFGSYLGSTVALIRSMNSMIDLHRSTTEAAQDFIKHKKVEFKARREATHALNQEVETFFTDYSRLSPGFGAELERIHQLINTSHSKVDTRKITDYVTFAQANYEAVTRGNNSTAIKLFTQILGHPNNDKRMTARSYYQRGLSYLLLCNPKSAQDDFTQAQTAQEDNLLYQFAVAHAKLLRLRGDDLSIKVADLKGEFSRINETLNTQGDRVNSGIMKHDDFARLFGYWYASLLTYEDATPESAAEAIKFLDQLGVKNSAVDAVRYSALKKIADSGKGEPPSIEWMKDALADCNAEISIVGNDRDAVPLRIRVGRWHKRLSELPTSDSDYHTKQTATALHLVDTLIRNLRSRLGVSEAVFNPITRRYDSLDDNLISIIRTDLSPPSNSSPQNSATT